MEKKGVSPCLRKTITFVYFLHLVIALALGILIISQHREVTKPSITFATLLIYAFMLPWALAISFLLIVCGQQQKAVCLTRIALKLLIMVFPVFGLLCIQHDRQLVVVREVKVFLLYMAVVAALLVVYQIASCLCCGQKYPQFLFEENDLQEAQAKVTAKRKEYDESIGKE